MGAANEIVQFLINGGGKGGRTRPRSILALGLRLGKGGVFF